VLRAGDEQRLREWTRSSTIPAGLARRARIVLLAAEGTSSAEVGRRVGVSLPTVHSWRVRYATTHALHAPNVHGSIGVALPGVEARIADPEDPTKECGPHQDGEVLVRGPIVTMGYYNNPEATAEAIDAQGWLHTGDVATHDGGGHFFIVDRLKDMIVTAGYNVYPAEIERVMIDHPSVALVAIGREPDEVKGEVAHAYVVLARGHDGNADELIAHCKARLSAYKVPRAVHFVDSLPTTSSGKDVRPAPREHRAAPVARLPARGHDRLARAAGGRAGEQRRTPGHATLVLAVVRGLLLDLEATGDTARTGRAFEDFLGTLRHAGDTAGRGRGPVA